MSTQSKPVTASQDAIQDGSAHIYVPYSAGATHTTADDSANLGAYFRLGAYSEIEGAAVSNSVSSSDATDMAGYFPREHLKDAGGSEAGTAPGPALGAVLRNAAGYDPGGKYKGGIMLACDGRMLVRAGEKLYIHAGKAIHVDAEDTVTIHAEKAILINSNDAVSIKSHNAKSIVINADNGAGDVTLKAMKETKDVLGTSYEYTTKDKYTYVKANAFSYKLGRYENYVLGATFNLTVGPTMTLKLAIDVSISISFAISLYIGKLDAGVAKWDFCEKKIEFTMTKVDANGFSTSTRGVAAKTTAAKVETTAVKTTTAGVEATSETVKVDNAAVNSESGGITWHTNALYGVS